MKIAKGRLKIPQIGFHPQKHINNVKYGMHLFVCSSFSFQCNSEILLQDKLIFLLKRKSCNEKDNIQNVFTAATTTTVIYVFPSQFE